MLRIFDAKPVRASIMDGFASAFVRNLALAVASAALAFFFFGVGFAAGDSPQPTSIGVIAILSTDVAGIAALGFWSGWRWARFPWPAVVLTPMLLTGVCSRLGDTDLGLSLGVKASAVLLLGALLARALKRLNPAKYSP